MPIPANRAVVSSQDSGLRLMRLLQLASPTLPVGAYSYSQGLERVVEDGLVHDEHTATQWIDDAMHLTIACFEGPALVQMLAAAAQADAASLCALNARFIAGRETAELRAESVQMGHSLARLLGELGGFGPIVPLLRSIAEPSYPCAWACAATAFDLRRDACYAAYLWAWLENQVMAAVKLVPLGQSAGQRMLFRLGDAAQAIAAGASGDSDEWINFAPGLALASMAHEIQYTRLFRS